MKLNVFGRIVEIIKDKDRWSVFYLGSEGKKRLADDILVPSSIKEEEIVEYIADLCHEWANPKNNTVTVLD